jgi:hypothetical protein
VSSNPFDFRLDHVRKQSYTIQLTPAEQREMTKYKRLYYANMAAQTMGPATDTLLGEASQQKEHFDPLTRSVVNRPLELIPNKYESVELTRFLQERR